MVNERTRLTEFHSIFPGGVRWRVAARGVECEGSGIVPVSSPARDRAAGYIAKYREQYVAASAESGVPVELLIACSLTESSAKDPERCVRQEPGYLSDEATPHRISAGFCQLLISTAREVMRDPAIDRTWLFSVKNSLLACAAYIKLQSAKTSYDPVCVACAYNAGGLYEQKGALNRWRLRQFPIGSGKHADRFVEYFNAALALSDSFDGAVCVRYRSLLP